MPSPPAGRKSCRRCTSGDQLAFAGVSHVGHNSQGLLAIARLDHERSVELAAVVPLLPARDGVEDGVAVAQAHGFDGHGIPGDIAESAHRGEGIADLVPIVARRHVGGSADARQARRIRRDGPTVLHIERDRGRRGNFFRQRDDRLRKAAGVIDVGGVVVAEPLHRLVIQRDGVPRQRRRHLQSSELLRLVGIVAQRELAGDRHHMRGAVDLHLKLIARDGEGLAVNGKRGQPCGKQENDRYQKTHRNNVAFRELSEW